MQTFLPHPEFYLSAKALDNKRLGKQRVETKQILLALEARRTNAKYGWKNHPATLMWEGYETALAGYGCAMCSEWRSRGFKDSLLPWFIERSKHREANPPWIGDEAIHASHRSNLLRKDPEFYQQFGWKESADLPYVWPTNPKDTHV